MNRVVTGMKRLLDRLIELVSPGPDSREELIESLADAEQHLRGIFRSRAETQQ